MVFNRGVMVVVCFNVNIGYCVFVIVSDCNGKLLFFGVFVSNDDMG